MEYAGRRLIRYMDAPRFAKQSLRFDEQVKIAAIYPAFERGRVIPLALMEYAGRRLIRGTNSGVRGSYQVWPTTV
jgi:hypothetical protein